MARSKTHTYQVREGFHTPLIRSPTLQETLSITENLDSTVTEAGAGQSVLLESSWNYATGGGDSAISDGSPGEFPDSGQGSSPPLHVEASGYASKGSNPGGNNALWSDEDGNDDEMYGFAAHNSNPWTPTSGQPRDFALRYYIRVDESISSQHDHHVQQHENDNSYLETFYCKMADNGSGFSYPVALDGGASFAAFNGSEVAWTRGTWYRWEILFKYNSADVEYRLFPRVYSVAGGTILTTAAGSLLYDWDEFKNTDTLATLPAFYGGNPPTNWRTGTPATWCWNRIMFGNNGQALRSGIDVTDAWAFCCVRIIDGSDLDHDSEEWVGDLTGTDFEGS